jgi:hypothetical protein
VLTQQNHILQKNENPIFQFTIINNIYDGQKRTIKKTESLEFPTGTELNNYF